LTLVEDLIYLAHLGKMIEVFFEILSYIGEKETLIMTVLPLATPLSLAVIFLM